MRLTSTGAGRMFSGSLNLATAGNNGEMQAAAAPRGTAEVVLPVESRWVPPLCRLPEWWMRAEISS